jgi:hypothetical protein
VPPIILDRALIAIDNASPTRTKNVNLRPAAGRFVLGALPVVITAVESQSRRCEANCAALALAIRVSAVAGDCERCRIHEMVPGK